MIVNISDFLAIRSLSELFKSTVVAPKQLWIICKGVDDVMLIIELSLQKQHPVDVRPQLQFLLLETSQQMDQSWQVPCSKRVREYTVGKDKGKILGKRKMKA